MIGPVHSSVLSTGCVGLRALTLRPNRHPKRLRPPVPFKQRRYNGSPPCHRQPYARRQPPEGIFAIPPDIDVATRTREPIPHDPLDTAPRHARVMHEKARDGLDEKRAVIPGWHQVREPSDPNVTPPWSPFGLSISKIAQAPTHPPNLDPHRIHVRCLRTGDGRDGEVLGINVVKAVECLPHRLPPHPSAAARARDGLAPIPAHGPGHGFGRRPPPGAVDRGRMASLDAVGENGPVPLLGFLEFVDEPLNVESPGKDLGARRSRATNGKQRSVCAHRRI